MWRSPPRPGSFAFSSRGPTGLAREQAPEKLLRFGLRGLLEHLLGRAAFQDLADSDVFGIIAGTFWIDAATSMSRSSSGTSG